MTPFFSVIIPLYNKADYIEETLQSVFAQTFEEYEIVIVDDGSTDDSVAVVKGLNHPKIKFFQQENKGAGAARNTAIASAKGKYLALLDADDFWYPNHLEALKESIVLFPEMDWFGNHYRIEYTQGRRRLAHVNLESSPLSFMVDDYYEASLNDSLAWTSAVAFSKTFFDKVGGFDEKLLTGQDIDLWIRMALATSFIFNPKTTMLYRKDAGQLSKSEYNLQRYQMLQKYQTEESTNKSLQQYLDINRYALAIRCKLHGEAELAKKTLKHIHTEHLNWKQRLLLKSPRGLLVLMKKVQRMFSALGWYVTAYR